jgi:acetylornithine deacetylase/succinyl-diaminopimelate desuccinylase-like protein
LLEDGGGEVTMKIRRITDCILVGFLLSAALGQRSSAEAQANPAAVAARQWCQTNEGQILAEYLQFLRIPNVSRDISNVRRNAEHLVQMMEKRGLHPCLLEVDEAPPLVYGELLSPGATATYVFYAHYDGQPVDPKEWATPPFEPALRTARLDKGGEVVPFPGEGQSFNPEWRIYARAASDDKAPILAILSALDALNAAGMKPRANLKFAFDGEEEIGSPHLKEILRANIELLRGDLWLICDGPEHASGRQTAVFGVRGIQPLEVTVYGANRELHSGHYGNWAPNPAMMLAQLLASMKDGEGRVLVEHFYDGVLPLSDMERKAVDEIPDTDIEQMHGLWLARVEGGGKKLAELINLPSLNIRGLSSGRTGSQAATIIPSSATVAIDMRLVKGVTRDQTVARLVDHIRKQGFYVTSSELDKATRRQHDKVALVVVDAAGANAVRTPMDIPVAQKVIAALRSVRTPLVLQPTTGGTLPLDVIEETLGVPTITVPIANYDNNQHTKDENIRLQNLWNGIEVQAALLMMD